MFPLTEKFSRTLVQMGRKKITKDEFIKYLSPKYYVQLGIQWKNLLKKCCRISKKNKKKNKDWLCETVIFANFNYIGNLCTDTLEIFFNNEIRQLDDYLRSRTRKVSAQSVLLCSISMDNFNYL